MGPKIHGFQGFKVNSCDFQIRKENCTDSVVSMTLRRETPQKSEFTMSKSSHPNSYTNTPELGTRQFFSFATTTTRQRNRSSRTSQGPEKIRKIVRPHSKITNTINFVPWKHSPIVATELSLAQLWLPPPVTCLIGRFPRWGDSLLSGTRWLDSLGPLILRTPDKAA